MDIAHKKFADSHLVRSRFDVSTSIIVHGTDQSIQLSAAKKQTMKQPSRRKRKQIAFSFHILPTSRNTAPPFHISLIRRGGKASATLPSIYPAHEDNNREACLSSFHMLSRLL